jgi:hypothetical protein
MNIVGLLFNMAGVFILFVFGFPQPSFEGSGGLTLEDNNVLENGRTVKEQDLFVARRKKLYKKLSLSGLVFIFIGFGLQLIANL